MGTTVIQIINNGFYNEETKQRQKKKRGKQAIADCSIVYSAAEWALTVVNLYETFRRRPQSMWHSPSLVFCYWKACFVLFCNKLLLLVCIEPSTQAGKTFLQQCFSPIGKRQFIGSNTFCGNKSTLTIVCFKRKIGKKTLKRLKHPFWNGMFWFSILKQLFVM